MTFTFSLNRSSIAAYYNESICLIHDTEDVTRSKCVIRFCKIIDTFIYSFFFYCNVSNHFKCVDILGWYSSWNHWNVNCQRKMQFALVTLYLFKLAKRVLNCTFRLYNQYATSIGYNFIIFFLLFIYFIMKTRWLTSICI